MQSEIFDLENLLRGFGLKINEEGSRSGNKKGGNDVIGSEGQEKGVGFLKKRIKMEGEDWRIL